VLELRDGRKLLADTNFWQTSIQFKTESGEPLVRFNISGLTHLNATVAIDPRAAHFIELPVIVMLGRYLIVMMNTDMMASAAIIG